MVPAVMYRVPVIAAQGDRTFVLTFRLNLRRLAAATAVLAFAVACPAGGHAQQAKLEARYVASLAGIPVGRGAWVLDIQNDQYSADASGATTGLLRVFASGKGRSTTQGDVANGQLLPRRYGTTIVADKKTEEVAMAIDGGTVTEFTVNPPPNPDPNRVPITEAHRHAITDPMTASLIRVSGNGDLLSADACTRSAPIFDGRLRYDLKMAFKRMETVKAEKGYQGRVVVCAIYFSPVAGYIPGRKVIEYLTGLRDMEVWLAPVIGTRVLVPYKVSIPTPLGVAVLEATQFVSSAAPGPTSASAKIP